MRRAQDSVNGLTVHLKYGVCFLCFYMLNFEYCEPFESSPCVCCRPCKHVFACACLYTTRKQPTPEFLRLLDRDAGAPAAMWVMTTPAHSQQQKQPPSHTHTTPEFPRVLVRDAGAPAAMWVVLHSPPDSDLLHVTVAWQVGCDLAVIK